MNRIVTDTLVIGIFMLINAIFAAAEMALVSLRDTQVKKLSGRGRRGQAVAELSQDPNRFLSAVSLAITLSGFMSAAFGGATLTEALTPVLESWGVPSAAAQLIALVTITLVISYFTIVLAELTAKRLAMQRAEGMAMALAPLVLLIARIARPVIWLLGVSTNLAVRVFGGDPNAGREDVSDEELRQLVSSSQTLGDEERQIVAEVFGAGQVSLRETMIPRTEVDFLDGAMPAHKALRAIRDGTHSRYPVVGNTSDDVLGFVHVRDLIDLDPDARAAPVGQLVRPVISLPETLRVLPALTQMRRAAAHLAIVRDEYGGTAGIVTLEDLVEELVGEITDEYDLVVDRGGAVDREAIIDGLQTLEEFAETTGLLLPEGPYDTVAGYVMARLGRLAKVDDSIEADLIEAAAPERGQRIDLTVAELDGRRAARLRFRRLDPEPAPIAESNPPRPTTPTTPGQ